MEMRKTMPEQIPSESKILADYIAEMKADLATLEKFKADGTVGIQQKNLRQRIAEMEQKLAASASETKEMQPS